MWLHWVILTHSEDIYLSNPCPFTHQILSWNCIVFTTRMLRISWLANKCDISLTFLITGLDDASRIDFYDRFSFLIFSGWSGSIKFFIFLLCVAYWSYAIFQCIRVKGAHLQGYFSASDKCACKTGPLSFVPYRSPPLKMTNPFFSCSQLPRCDSL